MRVHLTKYDIISLRQQAAESVELGDDGETFAEEALGCLGEEEIDAIETFGGMSAEEFLMQVYTTWEGGEPEMVIETLEMMLEEYDIEVTFEDDVDEEEYVAQWDDDVEVEDTEDFEEF